jgi:biopolymer transport protein ExbD
MKIRHSASRGPEQIRLQMTPMIDVVFQLLVFFIFTFKIVAQEGDFNVKMPLAAQSDKLPDDPQLPPMTVRLQADANGELAGISLNDNSFSSFQQLHDFIVEFIGNDDSTRESAEVELDCDYNLRYEYVISAITAVSGRLDASGNVVRLVEKIKFAAPRTPAEG